MLLGAIRDGLALLTWEQDGFAFADSFDESAGRYRGLRCGQQVTLADASAPGLLVKPEVARRQLEAERVAPPAGGTPVEPPVGGGGGARRRSRAPARRERPPTTQPTAT